MSEILRTYEHGVLRITINRPDKRNALPRHVIKALRLVFESHAEQPDLVLAVIGGAGSVAFCAGGDLVDVADTRTTELAEAFANEGTAMLDAIRLFPVPTVAVLNGIAVGGGAELALACDMRVAAHHARIGFIHSTLNIPTAWAGGADLMRLVGYGRATEMLATGRTLSADEARAMGLFNQVAPPEADFVDFVERFIGTLSARRPHVMRAIKAQAIAERFGHPVPERRLNDQSRFVEAWVDDAHWAAADRALK